MRVLGDPAATNDILPLDAPERVNLAGQWAALLKAAGARVSIDQTPVTGPAPDGAPKVSLVPTTQVTWDPPPGTCSATLTTELHFIVGTRTVPRSRHRRGAAERRR